MTDRELDTLSEELDKRIEPEPLDPIFGDWIADDDYASVPTLRWVYERSGW